MDREKLEELGYVFIENIFNTNYIEYYIYKKDAITMVVDRDMSTFSLKADVYGKFTVTTGIHYLNKANIKELEHRIYQTVDDFEPTPTWRTWAILIAFGVIGAVVVEIIKQVIDLWQ